MLHNQEWVRNIYRNVEKDFKKMQKQYEYVIQNIETSGNKTQRKNIL